MQTDEEPNRPAGRDERLTFPAQTAEVRLLQEPLEGLQPGLELRIRAVQPEEFVDTPPVLVSGHGLDAMVRVGGEHDFGGTLLSFIHMLHGLVVDMPDLSSKGQPTSPPSMKETLSKPFSSRMRWAS